MILLPTDYLLCSLIWEETMENKNKILLLEFIEDVKSHTNKKIYWQGLYLKNKNQQWQNLPYILRNE